MEPTMNGSRILSAGAVLALVLAMAAPAASLAEPHDGKGNSGAVRASGGFHGGKGYHGGGARGFGGGPPAARFSDGDPGYPGYRGTFISGSVVGAVGFYDNGYYEDGQGAVDQGPGGDGDDSVAYCMQTYRSYDRRSGTYVGYDGLRHPCP
jgi:hypothetical protein